jgi:hypothetical protein
VVKDHVERIKSAGVAYIPIVQRLTEAFIQGRTCIALVFVDEYSEPIAAEESVRRAPPRGALHWMNFNGLSAAGLHVYQPSRRVHTIYPVGLIAAADGGCVLSVWRDGYPCVRDPDEPLVLHPPAVVSGRSYPLSLFERF